MWRASDLYVGHPDWEIIKKSELSFEKVKKLKEYSDSIGIDFFCSAFYPEAVNFLKSLHVKKFKIASRTCLFSDPHSFETINQIGMTKKPTIVSMGMGGNKSKITKLLSKNKTLFWAQNDPTFGNSKIFFEKNADEILLSLKKNN